MKDKKGKQSTEELESFHQQVAEPKMLQPKHTVEDKFCSEDNNIGRDISEILDALPFYVLLIDEHHYILHANRAV